MASISLVNLNIQRSEHLDLVLPFLTERSPEVVALQEVLEEDLSVLAGVLGSHLYAPMSRFLQADPPQLWGTALFSKLPIREQHVTHYAGDPRVIPDLDQQDVSTWNNKNFHLAYIDVEKDGSVFRIMTTHLTWTPDGKPTDLQRSHTTAMLAALEDAGEFVLTGDFNAPRGGEIFGKIAEHYKDNIPREYTSSLDPDLHRVKGLELMVDGIFSTPAYTVSEVELISGVSDHKAVLATVSRAS